MQLRDYFTEHQLVQQALGPGDFRFSLLGAHTEIGEALAELPELTDLPDLLRAHAKISNALQQLPWRPWRRADQRAPSHAEVLAALPELADAIGAITRACVNLGVTPDEFEAAMALHLATKWERISNGVDAPDPSADTLQEEADRVFADPTVKARIEEHHRQQAAGTLRTHSSDEVKKRLLP